MKILDVVILLLSLVNAQTSLITYDKLKKSIQHTGTTLPSVYQDRYCNHLGQHIIFYYERNQTASNNPSGYSHLAIVELCKVVVNGYYKGWRGSDCSTPCPVNCIGDHCLPGNGSCVWGCNPDSCLNDICDTATGKCTQGCKLGLQGDYCEEPCAAGTFGNQCSSNGHCINQTCDPINGTCPAGGCRRGYKDITCSTECSLGYYGYNCNQSCDGCLSHSCDDYGDCTDGTGCNPGWQLGEMKCDRECDTGTCGDNCGSRCDTCVNRICDRFDGQCIYGCIGGFTGHDCLLRASPHSEEQTTNDIALYVGVTGIFMATVLIYRRKKRNGSENQQSGQKISKFVNDAFIDDYTNIGTEAHYGENIHQAQEQPYDSI